MAQVEFQDYPAITQLLERGGRPGVTYILALAQNVGKFQKEGWEMLSGMGAITVKGHSMILMGRGTPIRNASPEAWQPRYYVDREADQMTGLGPPKPAPKAKTSP